MSDHEPSIDDERDLPPAPEGDEPDAEGLPWELVAEQPELPPPPAADDVPAAAVPAAGAPQPGDEPAAEPAGGGAPTAQPPTPEPAGSDAPTAAPPTPDREPPADAASPAGEATPPPAEQSTVELPGADPWAPLAAEGFAREPWDANPPPAPRRRPRRWRAAKRGADPWGADTTPVSWQPMRMPAPRVYVLPPNRTTQIGVRVAAAVVLLACAALGYVLGHNSEPAAPSTLPNEAARNGIALRYPDGWREGSRAPAVRGLAFDDPLVVTAPDGADFGIVAGRVKAATGSDLLPTTLRAALRGSAPQPEPVRLGDIEALRYAGLEVTGTTGALTLYAIPSDDGSIVLTCRSPSAASAFFFDTCEQSIVTLKLSGPRTYPIGPDIEYGQRLATALRAIDAALRGDAKRLARAGSAAGQSSIARRLERRYADIAATLDGGAVSARDREGHDRLVASIRESAAAYRDLGAAARAADRDRYERASSTVEHADARTRAAVNALTKLGYTT